MPPTIHPLRKPPAELQTILVWGATAVAAAFLGFILAHWTLIWFAPAPVARLPAAPQGPAGPTPTVALFGVAAERAAVGAAQSAIRLLGVVAPSNRDPGYALLRIDGNQSVTVREGGPVAPGVTLAKVGTDHIVLERGGSREVLTWPESGRAQAGAGTGR